MKIIALTYCVVFLLGLTLCFVLTRSVRNAALQRRVHPRPRSGRDLHTAPIPRLGGVAIFFSLVLVLVLAMLVSPWVRAELYASGLLTLLLPTALIFLLGVYDDLIGVRPWAKFTVQGMAALFVFLAGYRVLNLPLLFGTHHFGWVASLVATVFWVLLITNAFNLVDGLDGLAAGSALFSTITLVVVAMVHGRSAICLVGLALAGATLGFLRYNFNPATIFLGDSGSLFIGFLLSVMALAGAQKSPTMVAVAIPIVSFGLPILETTLSVLRRFLSGQPLFDADRQHIHHKLLERGLSQRQVVVILYGFSALCGLMSMFLMYPGGPSIAIVLFVVGAVIWMGVQHLNYPEFFELRRVAHRTLEQKRIIINNLAFRRATYSLAQVQSFAELRRVLDETFRDNDFDGCELRWWANHYDAADDAPGSGAYLHYQWNRPSGFRRQLGTMADWALSLKLTSGDGESYGQLEVRREYRSRSLQVDVNLLIDEFRTVLAAALDRVSLNPESEPVGEAEEVPAALLARAD